ncbi:MAG: hypothetical protein U9O78_03510 [Patescibacteria group bacterium]|nr:hypothetical protein [Patescibacteria group bacterium]
MIQSDSLTQVADFINRANSILIILDQSAAFDQKVATSSLFLSLVDAGKKVEFLSQKEIQNGTIRGLDKIKTKMGNRNLLISFDYDENSVSKVSYHIDEENKKFYLTIKPKAGERGLNPETVGFEKTGIDADLMIFVGVEDLEDLNELYFGYEQDFRDITKISLSKQATDYADCFIENTDLSSCSEVVASLIAAANLPLEEPVATNLFAGINYETKQFSSLDAGASTFETAAMLIRAGAQRQARSFSKSGARPNIAKQEQKTIKVLEKSVKKDGSRISKMSLNPKSANQASSSKKVIKDKKKKTKKRGNPIRPSGLRV